MDCVLKCVVAADVDTHGCTLLLGSGVGTGKQEGSEFDEDEESADEVKYPVFTSTRKKVTIATMITMMIIIIHSENTGLNWLYLLWKNCSFFEGSWTMGGKSKSLL